MRLKWFQRLNSTVQVFILAGFILIFLAVYLPLSKYITPTITSFLSLPLGVCQDLTTNARQLLSFQDLLEENKKLKAKVDRLSAELSQFQEATQENERLRKILSLPQRETLKAKTALLIGRDSSNWTKTILINKGTSSGIKKGMAVIQGEGLVGEVIEVGFAASKVALLVDFNSKVAAKILRTREEGVVFGTLEAGKNVCKMKYIQDVKIGDKVISSDLSGKCPQGLLIGEVVKVEEEKTGLYKIAEVQIAVDPSSLEEVMVVSGQ